MQREWSETHRRVLLLEAEVSRIVCVRERRGSEGVRRHYLWVVVACCKMCASSCLRPSPRKFSLTLNTCICVSLATCQTFDCAKPQVNWARLTTTTPAHLWAASTTTSLCANFGDPFGKLDDCSLCNQSLRELSNPGGSGNVFYLTNGDS